MVGITRFGSTYVVKVFLNESNSETAIKNVQKTDSTSCKFVDFGSETVTVMMQVRYYNASVKR